MRGYQWGALASAIVFSIAVSARAQDMPPAQLPPLPEGALYKGVVGNVIEFLPLEDDVKVGLQRTNAVVSGPMTARSIALLLGVASPVLMVPGLIWGIWAALNIQERKPDTARWLGTRRDQPRLGFCSRDGAAHCTLAIPEPREAVAVTETAETAEPAIPPATELSLAEAEQLVPVRPLTLAEQQAVIQ